MEITADIMKWARAEIRISFLSYVAVQPALDKLEKLFFESAHLSLRTYSQGTTENTSLFSSWLEPELPYIDAQFHYSPTITSESEAKKLAEDLARQAVPSSIVQFTKLAGAVVDEIVVPTAQQTAQKAVDTAETVGKVAVDSTRAIPNALLVAGAVAGLLLFTKFKGVLS